MILPVNYTVANLLITDIFPKETQALAGAVYQVMSQLGISIGIAVLAVISNTVTDASPLPDKDSPEVLMKGFRAVFWTCFAMMVLSTLIGMWGLRGYKQIGSAKDVEHPTPKEPFHNGIRYSVEIRQPSPPPGSSCKGGFGVEIIPEPSQSVYLREKPLPKLPYRISSVPVTDITPYEEAVYALGLEDGTVPWYILGWVV